MPFAVGVAFRRVAHSYWYDPGDLALEPSDRVVVEAARNVEIGTIRVSAREVPEEQILAPLRRVLRVATTADEEQEERNRTRAADALRVAGEAVRRHALPMKLLSAACSFDGSQVTIEFAAENRVDFRELVKDLATRLRSKVQLYQVGARDEAKALGGLGPCGRALCCATFLTDFAPVSMKMAKDQSLFLNPVKFSGVCGKLMCCLRYEHEAYVDARRRLPRIGDTVQTPRGVGKVAELNVIKDEVTVAFQGSEAQLGFAASDVTCVAKGRCGGCAAGGGDHSPTDKDEAVDD